MVLLAPGQLPRRTWTDRFTKHDCHDRWHQAPKQSSIHHRGFAQDHAASLCATTGDGRGQNLLTAESGCGSSLYRLASANRDAYNR
jgi:hypothetical protein